MKLHMKLRTRLFLGFSALMTVALLGLMLALVSVMQMAKSQERLIGDNFTAIELNQQMRHALGNMLLARMHAETDVALLEREQAKFEALLERDRKFGDGRARVEGPEIRDENGRLVEEEEGDLFFYASQMPFPHYLEEILGDGYTVQQIISPYFNRLPNHNVSKSSFFAAHLI